MPSLGSHPSNSCHPHRQLRTPPEAFGESPAGTVVALAGGCHQVGGLGETSRPSYITPLFASMQINTSILPAWKRQILTEEQTASCQGLGAGDGRRHTLTEAFWGALQSSGESSTLAPTPGACGSTGVLLPAHQHLGQQ